ncbi:MAG: PEP-CTERM sorting domain-containing protein [Hyphomicrobiales bacterium]|nr:PEP-CTERM sorting domain-containing protein [Hyphomicrobiales bacterium]
MNASRTCSLAGLLLASGVALGSSTAPAAAQSVAPPQNLAPPSGAVLDLNGQSLPVDDPSPYRVQFEVDPADIVGGATTLTFLFRDDYAYIDFSNIGLYDLSSSTPNVNLLANGNFAGGTHTSNGYLNIPTGWTYVNPNPPGSNIFVAGGFSKFCAGGGKCWSDGTTVGYDELSQSVVVNSQDSYRVSFDATVTGVAPPQPGVEESTATWLRYSTNAATGFSGNAADILVYLGKVGNPAAAPPPPCTLCGPPIPEPSTWAMMLLGFASLAFVGYRRASASAA